MLLGEVADEIDRLNDPPDSMRRCIHAAETYLADMTEGNRVALREAYLAIPRHFRVYTPTGYPASRWAANRLTRPRCAARLGPRPKACSALGCGNGSFGAVSSSPR